MKRGVMMCLLSYILGILAFEKLGARMHFYVCVFVLLAVLSKAVIDAAVYKKNVRKVSVFMALFFLFGSFYTSFITSSETEQIKNFTEREVVCEVKIREENSSSNEYYHTYKAEILYLRAKKGGDICEKVGQKCILSVYIYDRKEPQKYKYGDVLKVSAKLDEVDKPLNAGETDYCAIRKADRIYYELSSEYKDLKYLRTDISRFDLYYYANNLRNYVTKLIDYNFGENEAALLKGMLVSRKEFSDEYYTRLTDTGVVHITVTSGLHVSCVFLFVSWLCFALGIKKKYTYMISAAMLFVYAFLQGLNPSVMRAVFMMWIYLGAHLLSRDYDSGHTLCITAFAMLLVNPYAIFDLGFLLSYASVAGIVLFEEPIRNAVSGVIKQKFICTSISTTLAVQIAIAPILAIYFNRISLYGIIANILIVPVLVPVMGLGFLFSAVGCIPVIGDMVSFVLGAFLKYINTVIYYISRLPFKAISIFCIDLKGAILYFLSALAIREYFVKGKEKYNFSYLISAIALAVIIVGFGAAESMHMRVHFINAAQSDAALIQLPIGKNVVIDGGGSSPVSKTDFGETVFVPYLYRNGVYEIDYAVVSHYEKDHAQGIAAALRNMKVKNLVLPLRDDKCDKEYKKIIEKAALEKGVNTIYFKEGDSFEIGGAVFEALAPTERNAKNHAMSENNKSLVLKLSYGENSFLFTGDVEIEAEAKLVKYGEKLKTDVLKVAHHGSNTSSSKKFIKTNAPKYAIINTKKNNLYNLPSVETIRNLADQGALVYMTEQFGTVKFMASKREIVLIDTLYKSNREEEIYLKSGAGIWLKNQYPRD